jgi:lipoate-protein ligase A
MSQSTAPPVWRLLVEFGRPGAHHMARDDALRHHFRPGRDRPILCLYSWRPACLTIGYSQPIASIDLVACRVAGIEVVRRPTGGRAVLHDGELTYSLIAAIDDPTIGGSITTSYRRISLGLLAGLAALGVAARLAPGEPGGDLAARRSGACFAAATRHEIVWQGRKLVGSAQARRHGVLLQHGSLPLTASRQSLAGLLLAVPTVELSRHLAAVTTTVAEITGQSWPPAAAANLLAPALAAALKIELRSSHLTPAERTSVARLAAERYHSPASGPAGIDDIEPTEAVPRAERVGRAIGDRT